MHKKIPMIAIVILTLAACGLGYYYLLPALSNHLQGAF